MTVHPLGRPRSLANLGGGLEIGLTYDLRIEYLARGMGEEETAEFDQPGTVDALEGSLRRLGFRTDRIGHADALCERLARGDRWDLVFNIAEGLFGMGRESLVPAILDHHRIPYTFSDPLTMAVTLHKGMAKRVVRSAGVPTPDFAVVESRSEIASVALPFPLFAKPVAEGTGKGVTTASIVRNAGELEAQCERLLTRYRQPVLVETLLPGRELTVGIVGTSGQAAAIGTLEIVLREAAEEGVYSYVNKENCEELVDYVVVSSAADPVIAEAERVALAAWRVLGCRDGGRVDLRCDAAGAPSFLEVNPLAGLHPEHSDLPILATARGIPYDHLLAAIMRSALTRVERRRPGRRKLALAGS
ncbi:MAG: D-alanine--D-alanine ligase [Acidobacteriota bacterium]|nr:D-alanine--D-alanine ligase [Acidobacteriota bacterium]MDH3524228.1 D-alanine--D-alanine ligase [Acidobacteriota bacterium]